MKLKKLLALCLITCATLSSTMVASADAKDSALPTDFISSTRCTYSTIRVKDNDSYNYIYNTCGLQLRVITYYTTPSPDRNVTKNGSAFIPGNAQRFITNLVRENYRQDIEDGKVTTEKCKCRLYIRAYVSGATGTLHGMWSPDSVGSCKVANP